MQTEAKRARAVWSFIHPLCDSNQHTQLQVKPDAHMDAQRMKLGRRTAAGAACVSQIRVVATLDLAASSIPVTPQHDRRRRGSPLSGCTMKIT
jgi:hypothetical protein